MPPEIPRISCPRCGNDDLYRMHRTWLLRRISLIWAVRKYTCYSCLRSFYVRNRAAGKHPRRAGKHPVAQVLPGNKQ